MHNIVKFRSLLAAISFAVFAGNILSGQVHSVNTVTLPTDSLTLKNIIERVVTTYPTVKVAEEALINADARIGLAGTAYNPELDISANYTNIGPVTKLTIPSMGTFQLYPDNNYSASVNYRQLIYDFGRTKQNVMLENGNKALGQQTLEQLKQKLSLMAVGNFYTLVFIQAAIKIKDEQLEALKEHLNYVETMRATGSSTEYQVLTTKVRISTVESQKVDLNAALATQQATLNSLLGNDQASVNVVKTELSVELPLIPSDSIQNYAFHNRDEMLINEKKSALAEMRFDLVNLQNKPVLNLQAAGGYKNGYIPDLNKIMPNYVVGLGIRIPILDGMKTKYNRMQAKSAITSLSYETDYTKRSISNELIEAESNLFAAEKKVSQFELQLAQAMKAYSLAETSFKSGTITNLDLLDANTSVSESRLMLLKARIDYAASVYKLKAALGERLY